MRFWVILLTDRKTNMGKNMYILLYHCTYFYNTMAFVIMFGYVRKTLKCKEWKTNYCTKQVVNYIVHTALYSRSSACTACSSARSFANCWLALSWLTTTLFLMLRARFAYFNVFSVSIKSRSDGEIQLIMTVRLTHTDHKLGNTWTAVKFSVSASLPLSPSSALLSHCHCLRCHHN